jgi:hypothetical protein
MPHVRQGAAAALHAPEQRNDITKHPLHKLVQHHGSRIDTRTAGHIISAAAGNVAPAAARRSAPLRTAKHASAPPGPRASAARRAPLRRLRLRCAQQPAAPPHSPHAQQRSRCAAHSAPPLRRTRRRASRTSCQRGATCTAAALRLRCAQQPAAAAPCPRAKQCTRCTAHSAPPLRHSRRRASRSSLQRGARCSAAALRLRRAWSVRARTPHPTPAPQYCCLAQRLPRSRRRAASPAW